MYQFVYKHTRHVHSFVQVFSGHYFREFCMRGVHRFRCQCLTRNTCLSLFEYILLIKKSQKILMFIPSLFRCKCMSYNYLMVTIQVKMEIHKGTQLSPKRLLLGHRIGTLNRYLYVCCTSVQVAKQSRPIYEFYSAKSYP